MDQKKEMAFLQQQQEKMASALQHVGDGAAPVVASAEVWEPAVDVVADDERLLICMDLPGVAQEQIQIRLNDDRLIVEGERRPRHEGLRLQRQECPGGPFHRCLFLPPGVTSEHLSARCHQGVLEIEIKGLTAEDQVQVDES
jgi:HSP20 family protein